MGNETANLPFGGPAHSGKRPIAGALGIAWLTGCLGLSGAEADISKLPPAITTAVDYTTQIKPILDQNCLKCHGVEKPKSGFSIVTRESLLKGGYSGAVALPGQSEKSPLIHYVARLVEDMEMPPEGKGEPLSRDQIALLRGWIDQGVQWSDKDAAASRKPELTLSPTLGGITVSGNEQQFREHHWLDQGWHGGLLELKYRQRLREDVMVWTEARALPNEGDYKFDLKLRKTDVGFVRFGAQQFRKYYSDYGGYYPLYTPSALNLERNLYLDIGKAWFEAGLLRPNLPKITLGYEYRYRDGSKSMLQWGAVGTAPPEAFPTDSKNYQPSAKYLDDQLHVIRLDLAYDWRGLNITDNLRLEFADERSRRENTLFYNTAAQAPERSITVNEGYRHFLAANTLRLEKQLKDWWFGSAGFLATRLDGQAAFGSSTFSPVGSYAFDDRYWYAQKIVLKQDTYIGNLNTLVNAGRGLSLSAGAQAEFQRQEGFGAVNLDENLLGAFPFVQPAYVSANLDKVSFEEQIGARYAGIPYTVLFAEGRFRQVSYGQNEELSGAYQEFVRSTESRLDYQEARAGFTVSPWRRVSLTSHYRLLRRHNNYDHLLDSAFGFPNEGYSAFIRLRDDTTHEVENKLTLRPLRWLNASLSHKLTATDFATGTEVEAFGGSNGGSLQAGNHDGQVFSATLSLTPKPRFNWSSTFSWFDNRTSASANGFPAVATWRGHTYLAHTAATYLLSKTTDLKVSYQFSHANYRQHNDLAGMPYGLAYDAHAATVGLSKHWRKNVTTSLRYGFYYYDEPSSIGFNNYAAHAIFGVITIRLP